MKSHANTVPATSANRSHARAWLGYNTLSQALTIVVVPGTLAHGCDYKVRCALVRYIVCVCVHSGLFSLLLFTLHICSDFDSCATLDIHLASILGFKLLPR
jgi:hypothetical protein